jgi:hypothetical protein
MVARDGIEPPTPAFSGLYSTIVISLIPFTLTPFSVVRIIEIL